LGSDVAVGVVLKLVEEDEGVGDVLVYVFFLDVSKSGSSSVCSDKAIVNVFCHFVAVDFHVLKSIESCLCVANFGSGS